MGYVGSQRLVLLLPDAHQASRRLLIPMSPDEVRSKLSAQLLEGADGVGRQPTEPNSRHTFQCRREGPTHDFICYSLKVHQGLEGL